MELCLGMGSVGILMLGKILFSYAFYIVQCHSIVGF